MNPHLDTSDDRELRELFVPLRTLEPTEAELAGLRRAVRADPASRRRRPRKIRIAPLRLGLAGGSLAVALSVLALGLDALGGGGIDGQQIVARAAAAVLAPPGGLIYGRESLALELPGSPPLQFLFDSWSSPDGGRQRTVLYGPGGTVRLELSSGPSGIQLYDGRTNKISYLPPLPPQVLRAAGLYGDGLSLYQAALRHRQGLAVTGATTLEGKPAYKLVAALSNATVTVLIDRQSYRPLQITTVQRGAVRGQHAATTVLRFLRFMIVRSTVAAQSLVRLSPHPGAKVDHNPRVLRALLAGIKVDAPRAQRRATPSP